MPVQPFCVLRQVYEATKCTASVGIGSNMLLAKLATSSAKPDGVFHIRPGADTDRWHVA